MKNKIAKFIVVMSLLTQLNLHAESTSPFLLSSEKMFSRNDAAALKEIDSFVFLFSLQMEKEEVTSIIDFLNLVVSNKNS